MSFSQRTIPEKLRITQKSSEKLRKAQKSSEKLRKAQKSSEKLRKAQKSSEKLRKAQKSSEKLRKAQKSSEKLRKAQERKTQPILFIPVMIVVFFPATGRILGSLQFTFLSRPPCFVRELRCALGHVAQ